MKRGFTLIELIVTVAVVMVLVGIGVTAMNSFTLNQKVQVNRDDLITQLKLARNMAITNQPASVGQTLAFTRIELAADGTITVYASTSNSQFFSKKLDNSTGLSISPSRFGFSAGEGRLTDETGKFIDGPINLTVSIGSDPDDIKTVIVNDLGLINSGN